MVDSARDVQIEAGCQFVVNTGKYKVPVPDKGLK